MAVAIEVQTQTLGQVCDTVGGTIRTGPFGSQLHESDYVSDGTPVVMPKDIVDGKVREDSIARIDDATLARLAQHKLEPGDIVYGRRGDIGRRALVSARERGWLCGTGCLRISLGASILDPQYLYYYLGQPHVVSWIANQAIGATLPNLNTSIIRDVEITYPPLPTQRKIAAILSAYDDLIENNARRIALLEEMARALYREWFVEFRYPGHQAVPLVDSPLGPIPQGWQVVKLEEGVELAYGKALRAEERREGSVPVYGSSGIVGYHDTSLVDGPGIIVGRKGNVGSVHWSDEAFYPIDTVYFVRSELPLPYLYFNLQGQRFINNDAAVPGLNRNQAYSLPLLIPTPEVLAAFGDFITPVFAQLRALDKANANLRRTRDLLLPRLVSGKVEVEDKQIGM